MSDAIVLTDTDYITVVYYTDRKIVHHTIHQPISGKPLREALNLGTATMAKYGACKWLSDDRLNGPLTPEDAEWGRVDWNARTIEAGWKYWANVVPYEVHAAGTLTPAIHHLYTLGLQMMVFTNLEEATEWLETRGC